MNHVHTNHFMRTTRNAFVAGRSPTETPIDPIRQNSGGSCPKQYLPNPERPLSSNTMIRLAQTLGPTKSANGSWQDASWEVALDAILTILMETTATRRDRVESSQPVLVIAIWEKMHGRNRYDSSVKTCGIRERESG
ncbi:hypothetical protein BaRGS_00019167 [Batillaria attramentaria]|uniref:Uncharacterized protein n=1 Tax=Batillaria attramentaria TaxID=370345 RepID=A0ABD0KQK9_9CAEN